MISTGEPSGAHPFGQSTRLIQAYLAHAAKIELVLPCVAKSHDPHAATAVADHQSEIITPDLVCVAGFVGLGKGRVPLVPRSIGKGRLIRRRGARSHQRAPARRKGTTLGGIF
jgi:hypothetical protein